MLNYLQGYSTEEEVSLDVINFSFLILKRQKQFEKYMLLSKEHLEILCLSPSPSGVEEIKSMPLLMARDQDKKFFALALARQRYKDDIEVLETKLRKYHIRPEILEKEILNLGVL